jgi:hypothetical protein
MTDSVLGHQMSASDAVADNFGGSSGPADSATPSINSVALLTNYMAAMSPALGSGGESPVAPPETPNQQPFVAIAHA